MIQDDTRRNYTPDRTAQDDTGRYRTVRTPPFLKTVEHREVFRGFESHSLRQRTPFRWGALADVVGRGSAAGSPRAANYAYGCRFEFFPAGRGAGAG